MAIPANHEEVREVTMKLEMARDGTPDQIYALLQDDLDEMQACVHMGEVSSSYVIIKIVK